MRTANTRVAGPDAFGMKDEALPIAHASSLSVELDELLRGAREYQLLALSPHTRRAYKVNWREFTGFCARYNFEPLPATPRTVELYLKWCADMRHHEPMHDQRLIQHHDRDDCAHPNPLKIASIEQRLATIATIHKLNDLSSPTSTKTIELTLEGIIGVHQRERGGTPKTSLEADELRSLLNLIGTQRIDIRDRAILLLTFLGGMRRSEIAAMRIEDVTIDASGIVYRLRESKTNRHGRQGVERKAIRRNTDPAFDPVRSYEEWLSVSGVREQEVFRSLVHDVVGKPISGDDIRDIVRRRVLAKLCDWLARNVAGDPIVATLYRRAPGDTFTWFKARFSDAVLDDLMVRFRLPETYDPRKFAAHSLRSGFVTSARAAGKADYKIKEITGHRTDAMLDRYTHSQELWRDNASSDLL